MIVIGLILLCSFLYAIFKPESQITVPSNEQTKLKENITFNPNLGINYSTTDNIEKTFEMGKFSNNVMINSISFTFDSVNSVFDNSTVKISIININNDVIYSTTITNFKNTPIVVQINYILINKDSKVNLILNGKNTRIFSPSISINYYVIPVVTKIPSFPPASITKLNTKIWPTVISKNPYGITFPELCPSATIDYGINIPDINKVSLAISGGGSRSFTCMIGYFRALNRMGYKNKAQYVSSVSGGSWFYGLYSFCQGNPKFTDEILLGESCGFANGIIDPSKITIEVLNDTNKSNSLYYGRIFEKKDLLEYVVEAIILPSVPIDLAYNYSIGKLILEKYGLNEDVPVATSLLHANDISSRNIFKGSPLVMPPNSPFWICNTTLFFNYVSESPYPFAVIPMTPLYSGVPQSITQNNNTIGGYLVENFAFGNTEAPTDIQISSNTLPCSLPYFTSLKKNNEIRTLRDMLGPSSIAFASVLYQPQNISNILATLLPKSSTELIPKYNIWGDTPPVPTTSDSQCTSDLIKGGCKVPYGYDVNSCARIGPQCYSITAPQCTKNSDCNWSFSKLQCVNKNKNTSELTCRANPSFFKPLGCKCVSPPTYTANNSKYLNNQNAKLSDGGAGDNLGILSLLARGVKKIIAFINGLNYYDPNCDILALFGKAPPDCVVGGSSANNQNQVFNSRDYENILLPEFKNNTKDGGPAFARLSLDVLPNYNNCITGGYKADLLLINLQPCDRFLNRLPDGVKNQINSGLFSNFPNYKTFFQNLNLGIISLTFEQSNLLSTYTDWCLNQPELKKNVEQMFA